MSTKIFLTLQSDIVGYKLIPEATLNCYNVITRNVTAHYDADCK